MPNPHPAGTVTIPGLMAEAQAAQKAGEAAQAARLYAQVLELRPDHAGAWLARIEIALGRGKARRARKLCEAALTQCPGHRVAIVTKQARALEAGADGVIASAQEAAMIRGLPEAQGRLIVTPGIRPAGAAAGDQKRIVTPGAAVASGADHIVVGRPVWQAGDPRAAAQAIVAELNG